MASEHLYVADVPLADVQLVQGAWPKRGGAFVAALNVFSAHSVASVRIANP
jgi:hypothetical protein